MLKSWHEVKLTLIYSLFLQQYLRGLCRQPHTVKWKTLLGKEKSPHELQKLIKIHVSSWPFENTAVVSHNVYSYT